MQVWQCDAVTAAETEKEMLAQSVPSQHLSDAAGLHAHETA